MTLKIKKESLAQIKAFGEAAYPSECCGFLLGKISNDFRQVMTLLPATNEFKEEEKHHRFLMTPRAYLQAEKTARAEALDIIGFYHSHPDADAKPSAYDLEHGWPWYSYVIISIRERHVREITSWILQDSRDGFDQEDLIIDSRNPHAIKEDANDS